jgi:hypothetical protein
MKTSSKVGLGFGIILVLAIGTIAFLGMVEQDVKSQYTPIDQNNPCRISGSTFDSVAQSQACDTYLNSKNQQESALANSLKVAAKQIPTEKKITMPSVNTLKIQLENLERTPDCEYLTNLIDKIQTAMNTGGIQYTQQHKDLFSDFQELEYNNCK